MDETVVRRTIGASPERVWTAVRAVGGLERWFPVIETCAVTGQRVGAVRVLGLVGGGELHDRIEEVDDVARRLRYVRTVHPFPTRRYVGTVTVAGAPEARTDLTWTLDLDVEAADREELLAFLAGAVGDGVAGLGRRGGKTLGNSQPPFRRLSPPCGVLGVHPPARRQLRRLIRAHIASFPDRSFQTGRSACAADPQV